MKPQLLKWQTYSLELGSRTRIMGVLNVTPDSFSDGGSFFSLADAISQAEGMAAQGADIIDVGGESSRPFSHPVSAEEECRRVLPVIEELAGRIPLPISIDTTKAEVARRAIGAGASIVNDISALRFDPELGRVVAENDVLLVLMHMKGMPANMQLAPVYEDLLGEIHAFLAQAVERAEACGIERSRLIIDPGIGFGKTVTDNLRLIYCLAHFQRLGLPLLIGPSRKAFIRKLLSSPDAEELLPTHPLVEAGTQASVSASVLHGAQIVRVHDVATTAATIRILDAARGGSPCGDGS